VEHTYRHKPLRGVHRCGCWIVSPDHRYHLPVTSGAASLHQRMQELPSNTPPSMVGSQVNGVLHRKSIPRSRTKWRSICIPYNYSIHLCHKIGQSTFLHRTQSPLHLRHIGRLQLQRSHAAQDKRRIDRRNRGNILRASGSNEERHPLTLLRPSRTLLLPALSETGHNTFAVPCIRNARLRPMKFPGKPRHPHSTIGPSVGTLALLIPLAIGCASPGNPRPPTLNLPQVVTDLTAQRIGNQVQLHWTTPSRTTDRLDIVGNLTAEVCRQTNPSSVGTCVTVQHLSVHPGPSQTIDPLPQLLTADPAVLVAYRIQIFNVAGRSADPSGQAFAAAGAAPPTIAQLRATPTKDGALIEWLRQTSATPIASTVELDRVPSVPPLLKRPRLNLPRNSPCSSQRRSHPKFTCRPAKTSPTPEAHSTALLKRVRPTRTLPSVSVPSNSVAIPWSCAVPSRPPSRCSSAIPFRLRLPRAWPLCRAAQPQPTALSISRGRRSTWD